MRQWQFDPHQHFIGLQVGGEATDEKVPRVAPALASCRLNVKSGIERDGDCRQLRCRIGMRKVSPDCTAGADLRMCNVGATLPRSRETCRQSRYHAPAGDSGLFAPTYAPLSSCRRTSPKPSIRLMSMRTAGCANRKFIAGIKLCPPARNFASSPYSALSVSACSSEVAAIYLKAAGFMALATNQNAVSALLASRFSKYEVRPRASQKAAPFGLSEKTDSDMFDPDSISCP